MQQHPVLNDELDIDHAAAIVLDVEQLAAVRMTRRDALAHRHDFRRERPALARRRQYPLTDLLERSPDLRIARAKPRAGQRLMLPDPSRVGGVAFAQLIAPKRPEVR